MCELRSLPCNLTAAPHAQAHAGERGSGDPRVPCEAPARVQGARCLGARQPPDIHVVIHVVSKVAVLAEVAGSLPRGSEEMGGGDGGESGRRLRREALATAGGPGGGPRVRVVPPSPSVRCQQWSRPRGLSFFSI